jgi:excisionase family DNA binding protein
MSRAGPGAERLTYTLGEFAVMIGISERLARELVRQGHIPVLRLGRRVLVRRATLERLLAEPEGAQAPIVELPEARQQRTAQTRLSKR